jgi:para-aminobenzoate synthetase component I
VLPSTQPNIFTLSTKASITNCIFSIPDFEAMKLKVLSWVQPFSTFCFLDNHQYQIGPQTVECLLAAGCRRRYEGTAGNALDGLQHFIDENNSWLFGHLGYDLKNEMEGLTSAHPDYVGFPDTFFFEPEIVIKLSKNEMQIEAEDPASVFEAINNTSIFSITEHTAIDKINSRLSKDEYVDVIRCLRSHIQRGDCYEINYCQEFFAEQAVISPLSVYKKLSRLSPNPFSALYRLQDKWLICASPERFIKKQGEKILSQPIKGTSKRILSDNEKDQQSKNDLQHSTKDRSENVMVVDLVRNDLSKVCKEGSVTTDELYGIYSFPQVHQMISTISGSLKDGISFTDIIKATFPMGSMTGAPKKRVMELIEQYEKTKRGIFSGAVGYIAPKDSSSNELGDFDFNVVIRSIMYNSSSQYLSFQAGSGITYYSDPIHEWEECLLKAKAMKQVLSGTGSGVGTVE